ncbi:DUF2071 domain-containing protein [Longispora sp. NPDC051575]|uniref:DUF2071 domain-containing protein n=1 Tax=Longispora sp. NPDC051575 TaxID=3154943 RepID=UPI003419381A
MRLDSVVERRLLVNYRVAPGAVAPLLPTGMRPQIVNGWAVAGICLIRLGRVRPAGLPDWFGLRSENAAHRIAVEWDGGGGVYIPRRDTGSALNALAGGRVFPGVHHRVRFDVEEHGADLRVAYTGPGIEVSATGRVTAELTGSALFADLAEASEFFRRGSVGYSAADGTHVDGLALETASWRIEPVELGAAWSSYFEDPARFPAGTAVLDSALVMRNLPATWRAVARRAA